MQLHHTKEELVRLDKIARAHKGNNKNKGTFRPFIFCRHLILLHKL